MKNTENAKLLIPMKNKLKELESENKALRDDVCLLASIVSDITSNLKLVFGENYCKVHCQTINRIVAKNKK